MVCNVISGLDQAGGKNQGTGLQDELAVQEAPFVTPAEAGAQAKNQTIRMGSRVRGNDGGGGSAVVARTVGRMRRLIALIDQPSVGKRSLAHLGLPTEASTRPEESIWRVRGPPDELFPPDLDDAGLPVDLEAIDADPGDTFFDELPAEDWAA